MDYQELVDRYKRGKSVQEELTRRIQKLEATREVARQKEESLREDVRKMGLDPDTLEEWVQKKYEELSAQMQEFEEKSREVSQGLDRIEECIRSQAKE